MDQLSLRSCSRPFSHPARRSPSLCLCLFPCLLLCPDCSACPLFRSLSSASIRQPTALILHNRWKRFLTAGKRSPRAHRPAAALGRAGTAHHAHPWQASLRQQEPTIQPFPPVRQHFSFRGAPAALPVCWHTSHEQTEGGAPLNLELHDWPL